jgi:hypothetical protein
MGMHEIELSLTDEIQALKLKHRMETGKDPKMVFIPEAKLGPMTVEDLTAFPPTYMGAQIRKGIEEAFEMEFTLIKRGELRVK